MFPVPRGQPGRDVPGSGAVVGAGLVPGKGSQSSGGACTALPAPHPSVLAPPDFVPFPSCCPNPPLAKPSVHLGTELTASKKMEGYKHLER